MDKLSWLFMGNSFKDFDVCKSYKHKFKEKLIKYIHELYDQRSEFNSINDLKLRKQAICDKVGINPKEPWMVKIMELKDEAFNELAFHYQSYFRCSNAFQQMLTDQHLFWNMQRMISKPIDVTDEDELMAKYKKRAELSELSDKIQKRVHAAYNEMYKDDEEMKEVAGNTVRKTASLEQRIKDMQNV